MYTSVKSVWTFSLHVPKAHTGSTTILMLYVYADERISCVKEGEISFRDNKW